MKRIEQYIDDNECEQDNCYEHGWLIEPDTPMSGRSVKDGNPYFSKYLRATVVVMTDHDSGKVYKDTWVVGLDSWDHTDTNGVITYTCQGALTLDEILFTVLGTINKEEDNAPALR